MLFDTETGEKQFLTNSKSLAESRPHWSPDGTMLAIAVADEAFTTFLDVIELETLERVRVGQLDAYVEEIAP